MPIMATYHNFLQSSETPLALTWCSKKRAFYSQDPHWLSADAHDAGFWPIVKLSNFCSPCSPWWPLPYFLGVGLVLLLHSFRSRSLSAWVTPIPVISSFICWCHVFMGVLVVWYLVLPGPSLCGWRCSHKSIFSGHLQTNEDGHCITSSGKSVICVECRCFACDPVSTLQGSREASSPQW